MPKNIIKQFLRLESASGIILMISASMAILIANSPLQSLYNLLIETPVAIQVGAFTINKPLLLWINDGLMALFFFLIGLELKREFIEGELSDRKKITLPIIGAIGGMAIPALIYAFMNWDNPVALKGWAIPAATDIAFALGILLLLGKKVPTTAKIFLTSLAIFDDIGAIAIIAIFYTSNISVLALMVAAICITILFILNKTHVSTRSIYLIVGLVMWVALLKSGVHATLAGVILALFIPIKDKKNPEESPLKILEHDLHGLVAFVVLPVFAFVNAGINLSGVGLKQIIHGVPFGIVLGLFIGKQIGIFGLCWLSIKLKLAKLPEGINWMTLYGISCLCGVGFTMSLFIGSLAFEETQVNMLFDERLGILIGSLLSGILGYIVLSTSLSKNHQKQPIS